MTIAVECMLNYAWLQKYLDLFLYNLNYIYKLLWEKLELNIVKCCLTVINSMCEKYIFLNNLQIPTLFLLSMCIITIYINFSYFNMVSILFLEFHWSDKWRYIHLFIYIYVYIIQEGRETVSIHICSQILIR